MEESGSIVLQPIGWMRSPWREKFGVPRQPGLIPDAVGEVVFAKQYEDPEARAGLEGFSHLWVTFLFDRVPPEAVKLRVRPPRLGGNEKRGVFATRSPFRPNRIGLSVCEIESVYPTLRLRGVDLVDGTPILDIRPYVPYVDSIPEAQGGFATGEPERIEVEIPEDMQGQWMQLAPETQGVLRGLISLQPGPAYHEQSERSYAAQAADWEVKWQVVEGRAILASLESMNGPEA